MFDIAWGEFVVIGVVALIVIGPKELPGVLRAVGQWTTKIRRMASEFQSQFQEALREAEMADLKKEVNSLTDSATKAFTFDDPLNNSEATKWERKTDDANKADDKPAAAQPSESAPVTPDGYVVPEAVAETPAAGAVPAAAEPSAAEHHVAALNEEAFPLPAAPPPLPEGSGQ